ncbi:MAG TPA: hypothetical protein VKZ79_04435 [Alphaproteobacteria bacterium]|nr:hypothetical protein [Alphaproteobacteria bacterium]
MIWADRVAIGLAILAAFGIGVAFVSSDAALRLDAVRSHIAKLDAACAQQLTAARKATEEASADSNTSPAPPESEVSKDAQATAEDVQTVNPVDAPAKIAPLPDRVCFDMKVRDELESEEAAITVPTVRGTLLDLVKLEIFGVVPLWAGLRYLDFQSGGPQRRLARSRYWMATRDARRARRRERRERFEAGEP